MEKNKGKGREGADETSQKNGEPMRPDRAWSAFPSCRPLKEEQKGERECGQLNSERDPRTRGKFESTHRRELSASSTPPSARSPPLGSRRCRSQSERPERMTSLVQAREGVRKSERSVKSKLTSPVRRAISFSVSLRAASSASRSLTMASYLRVTSPKDESQFDEDGRAEQR